MKRSLPLEEQIAGLFGNPERGIGESVATLPLPIESIPSPEPPLPQRRKKLWELEDKHHCPIVGTCLPMAELSKLGRRLGLGDDPDDEFSMHVDAAGRSGTRNPVSLAIHKHLDAKYAAVIARFDKLKTDAAVRAEWRGCYSRGEIAGPLWAALTHRAASAETRQAIYGDIHMLSHQVGAGQAADARRLAHLDKENAALRATIDGERRERQRVEDALRAELQALSARSVRLDAEAAEAAGLRARLEALESGVAIVDIGRKLVSLSVANEQLAGAAQRAGELDRQVAGLAGELRAARQERDQLTAERDALERLLSAPEAGAAECGGECSDCERAATARCVLCVGGRTALVAQYRALAERLGIRLIHHDGGQEEALSRLPDMINGADAVICPTDCVSHSAYYRLKQHCKRTGKPCLLFKGAGVSGFAVALSRLASGRVSLAGAATEVTK